MGYYFNGQNILGPDEVVHLRDWSLGDIMVIGTLESRFKMGKIIFLGFSDFGDAWYSDYAKSDWIVTAGIEMRIDLFGFVIAYGTAQTLEHWKDDKHPKITYVFH